MRKDPIRIGTRESQLAIWQADLVKKNLEENGHEATLVAIKSEGDIDLVTPLYAMGVQGVFTRSLDAALLSGKIDIAVHSMKDVPVQLPTGIAQAAVLKRANHKDILVVNDKKSIEHQLSTPFTTHHAPLIIATSSVRRKAQWLHRYPQTTIENLRGNVNTRLKKVAESGWHGAIFAAAGLERINVRPDNSLDLDWMLPAPAQGAIMVVARESDAEVRDICAKLNDPYTAIAVKIERDFLSALMGGCSTPISALAQVSEAGIVFEGNIVAPDGSKKIEVNQHFELRDIDQAGASAAQLILEQGGDKIISAFNNAK
ncbi:hydroxymethylbilane synthase [Niabella insulamsoli]|uniref:hydroxymethylbilane synthase n=1 Tax=Niabella insulamsoli TaxID=3144874 RepID=UPI0031FDC385